MKKNVFLKILIFLFFCMGLKAYEGVRIFAPGGYADRIQSLESDIKLVSEQIAKGDKKIAAETIKRAQETLRFIKDNGDRDVKNYSLLRAYLSGHGLYPSDKIFIQPALPLNISEFTKRIEALNNSLKDEPSLKALLEESLRSDYIKKCIASGSTEDKCSTAWNYFRLELPHDLLDGEYVKKCMATGKTRLVCVENWHADHKKLLELIDKEDEKKIKELLDKNPYLDIAPPIGGTPFEISRRIHNSPLLKAIQNKKVEIIKLLLDELIKQGFSAKINQKYNYPTLEGNNILMLALNLADSPVIFDIVKLLIEKGADVNAKGNKDNTSLHYAVALDNKRFETVEYLISRGADPKLTNNLGRTPLAIAKSLGNEDVKKLLEEEMKKSASSSSSSSSSSSIKI